MKKNCKKYNKKLTELYLNNFTNKKTKTKTTRTRSSEINSSEIVIGSSEKLIVAARERKQNYSLNSSV